MEISRRTTEAVTVVHKLIVHVQEVIDFLEERYEYPVAMIEMERELTDMCGDLIMRDVMFKLMTAEGQTPTRLETGN